ncbi:MAG: DUF1524 domain-containing protein [Chloroflexi bacterium]|nr:DUF1524 domain-containing protein [Chloroflexota bacterium]
MQIIAENLNGDIVSPYTGEVFSNRSQTDIEHIVATSEAHDSGLCAATESVRRQFAKDLDNLTLASPSVNRHQKSDKDLADWLPAQNICWFVQTVVQVKAKYGLSMDSQEANVAITTLKVCNPKPACYKSGQADTLNCYAGRSSTDSAPTAASTTSTACYTDDSAYVNGAINVRSGAGVNFAKVDVVQSANVSVLDSTHEADFCWLKIGENRWIAQTHFVLASHPSVARTTSTRATSTATPPQVDSNETCYTDDSAYVNGTINVRSGAGVNFAKVDVVQSATVSVLDSTHEADFCWLKIGENRWIARLNYVLATKPAVVVPTAQPVVSQPVVQQPQAPVQQPQQPSVPNLESVDSNGNGRITCAEARAAGLPIPVRQGHWAYPYMRDSNNDGMVCT